MTLNWRQSSAGVTFKTILDTIGNLKGNVAGMLGDSKEVIQESRTLAGLTAEIGNGIQEMASGAEQIHGGRPSEQHKC